MSMKLLLLIALSVAAPTAFAEPCGTEGTIEERIKHCNQTKESFALVIRDQRGLEIYKDLKTSLLWGDRIGSDFNAYGSQKACADGLPESLLLSGMSWRLPTIREFETAKENGMKASVSRMNHTFWTSTPVKTRRAGRRRSAPSLIYLWDAVEEKTDHGDIKDAASVRCVAVQK